MVKYNRRLSFLAVFLLRGANEDTWGENRLDTFQLLNYALYLVAASHETSHTHTHRDTCVYDVKIIQLEECTTELRSK